MKTSKPKKQFHSKNNERNLIFGILLSAVAGSVVGIASFMLLLAIFSAVCIASSTPLSLVMPATLASIYLSAFICGFVCVKKSNKCSPWLCSLLGTIFFYMMLFLLSIPFSTESTLRHAFLFRLIIMPCSALGTLCGSKKSSSKHKNRYR